MSTGSGAMGSIEDILVTHSTDLMQYLNKGIINTVLRQDPPRKYMGMSSVGDDDERKLWLNFRWSWPDQFNAKYTPNLEITEDDARIWRLFQDGHRLEASMAEWVRMTIPRAELVTVGVDGKQIGFNTLGGHFRGHTDGGMRGVPGVQNLWHIFEAKSANKAQFNELLKVGSIRLWHDNYYGQVQCYMALSGMGWAVFFVYCKDDGRMYCERIKFKRGDWEKYYNRARKLITLGSPPPPAYKDESFYKAKWHSPAQRDVYWGRKTPEWVNCRNCQFSQPDINDQHTAGLWFCNRYRQYVDIDRQRVACPDHRFIPSLVPARHVESGSSYDLYETDSGIEFFSADSSGGSDQHSSFEIAKMSQVRSRLGMMDDPGIQEIKSTFGATVTEVKKDD